MGWVKYLLLGSPKFPTKCREGRELESGIDLVKMQVQVVQHVCVS